METKKGNAFELVERTIFCNVQIFYNMMILRKIHTILIFKLS